MSAPVIDLDAFGTKLLVDAWNEGSAAYWLRRAAAFEDAKPRAGDFHGRATREDLRAAWRRCDEAARACRARAEAHRRGGAPAEIWAEVGQILREVA